MCGDPDDTLLYKKEDWWGLILGLVILTVAVVSGLANIGLKAPRIQSWIVDPTDAFYENTAVKVQDWPADGIDRLPPEMKDKVRLTKELIYEKGEYKTVEKIVWYSRHPVTAMDIKALRALGLSGDDEKISVMVLYERSQAVTSTETGLAYLAAGLGVPVVVAAIFMGAAPLGAVIGFVVIFVLTGLAYVIGGYVPFQALGLSYAPWALLLGLAVSNTIGTPKSILSAARTGMFIMAGLVLLGAEISLDRITSLGPQTWLVAAAVPLVVIIIMRVVGTAVLRLSSGPQSTTMAAAASGCGAWAAIPAGLAARAKRADVTLAVLMAMLFAAALMIGMPPLVKAAGASAATGGAWMGGGLDGTGPLASAAATLDTQAEMNAIDVKIGQFAFIVVLAPVLAVVCGIKRDEQAQPSRSLLAEILCRLPKFAIGVALACLAFSFVLPSVFGVGTVGTNPLRLNVIEAVTWPCRDWLFCMAFVSIGLESNLRHLIRQTGGRPVALYLIGLALSLGLTFAAAHVAFGGAPVK